MKILPSFERSNGFSVGFKGSGVFFLQSFSIPGIFIDRSERYTQIYHDPGTLKNSSEVFHQNHMLWIL